MPITQPVSLTHIENVIMYEWYGRTELTRLLVPCLNTSGSVNDHDSVSDVSW